MATGINLRQWWVTFITGLLRCRKIPALYHRSYLPSGIVPWNLPQVNYLQHYKPSKTKNINQQNINKTRLKKFQFNDKKNGDWIDIPNIIIASQSFKTVKYHKNNDYSKFKLGTICKSVFEAAKEGRIPPLWFWVSRTYFWKPSLLVWFN